MLKIAFSFKDEYFSEGDNVTVTFESREVRDTKIDKITSMYGRVVVDFEFDHNSYDYHDIISITARAGK